jgi:hypothetical protein
VSTQRAIGEARSADADQKSMQILFSRARLAMDATGLLFAFGLIALVSQNA